jgi:hypothetical protein
MPKRPIIIPPTILHITWSPNPASPATRTVKKSNNRVYVFELLSNVTQPSPLWTKRPMEKAPRMLEIVEPTMFPTARDDRWRASETTTTASFVDG